MIKLRALFDDTVASALTREALTQLGLDVSDFPPADFRYPATTVLNSALSAELRAAGIVVATSETLIANGIDYVREKAPQSQHDAIDNIENNLWQHVDAIVDAAAKLTDADLNSTLGNASRAAAAREFDADVLITNDSRLLTLEQSDGVQYWSPRQWLEFADGAIRAHRAEAALAEQADDQGSEPQH